MSVLDTILKTKTQEVEALKANGGLTEARRRALALPAGRSLKTALRTAGRTPIIAEIKRSSPSAGSINSLVDVKAQAALYQEAGAAAVSVLTDRTYFQGDLEDVRQARTVLNIPILRKDFIIDPIQLYETKLAGADAALLIVAALEPELLRLLYTEALDLGLSVLVETHNEEEVQTALTLNPSIIGVNNRNLSDMTVNLETCARLRTLIPRDTLVIGESGINSPADVSMLLNAGINGFLVGSSLMRSDDPDGLLKALVATGSA